MFAAVASAVFVVASSRLRPVRIISVQPDTTSSLAIILTFYSGMFYIGVPFWPGDNNATQRHKHRAQMTLSTDHRMRIYSGQSTSKGMCVMQRTAEQGGGGVLFV